MGLEGNFKPCAQPNDDAPHAPVVTRSHGGRRCGQAGSSTRVGGCIGVGVSLGYCNHAYILPMLDAMSPDQLQLLVTREMPFGKYKGRILADLPGNYLNWFAREGFPAGEIGRLLALMHEIDHNGLKHLLQPLRRG